MDKVKKFVIFPISLFAIELILQYNQSTLDNWKSLFVGNANFAWLHILLGILAILLYILGIAVLFLWVFTDTSPKTLLNQSTVKSVGIAFAIDYLIILWTVPMLYFIMPRYRLDTTPWLYIFLDSLILASQSFFVISMILWVILKPLHAEFKFRTKTFLIAVLVCLILNLLFSYENAQLNMAVVAKIKTYTNTNIIGYLYMLAEADTNQYINLLCISRAIVYAIQDVIILVFINSCIKHKESVEMENI